VGGQDFANSAYDRVEGIVVANLSLQKMKGAKNMPAKLAAAK
jgi:hypothetical protein